ncbi:MAG: YdbH domain-containing protein [Xanthomonadales bacterium]|nr:YdbH domain-containing protein [Xanthomonadales bacterium]
MPRNSIAQDQRHAKSFTFARWLFAVAFLAMIQDTLAAPLPELRFSAETIEHEKIVLQDVQGQLLAGGGFRLAAHHAVMVDPGFEFADISIEGTVADGFLQDGQVVLKGDIQSGVYTASFDYIQRPDEVFAVLKVGSQDLVALKSLPGLPPQADWLSAGHLGAELSYSQTGDAEPELVLRLDLNGLGFDSPDGRFAAEGLTSKVEISASLSGWSAPAVKGSISGGELLVDDFYRNFAGGDLGFVFKPAWNDSGIQIRSFSFTDRHSLNVEGRAGWDFSGAPDSWRLEISRLDLRFPGAYERYLEPMVAAWTLDGLGVTGQLSWSGQWSEGEFRSGDLGITDLSIVDIRRNRFAFTGLEARMRPGDHTFNSSLSWRGLLMGRINLGPGELALDSEPGKFAILHPLVLDVLGGRVVLNELAVLLPGGSQNGNDDPDIRLRMDLEDLDMEQLTVAFDWPLFAGKISGHIPGVSFDDGVLDVEGKILVNVFDGTLSLADLRVERLFGVLPSLAANVEAVNLDLEQITRTFSFGQISGRVDGYIRDLRMLDWKPVAFDAWFGTPASQKGTKDISRKAFNHLTTLGGGGATTALTSPVMKLFNNFSYKSLGLGCRMQNNVCEIRGVSEDEVSVLIMEGAGVPKITIRAFNRRVDWPQLLAQLIAASEGESVKIDQ